MSRAYEEVGAPFRVRSGAPFRDEESLLYPDSWRRNRQRSDVPYCWCLLLRCTQRVLPGTSYRYFLVSCSAARGNWFFWTTPYSLSFHFSILKGCSSSPWADRLLRIAQRESPTSSALPHPHGHASPGLLHRPLGFYSILQLALAAQERLGQ